MVNRINVLGDLQIFEGSEALSGPGPVARSMLGYLVVHAGRPLGTDRLLNRLCGGVNAPRSRRKIARAADELTELLGSSSGDDAISLRRSRDGSCLRVLVPRGASDLDEWRRLAERGREAATLGDPWAALEPLGRALALWRGELLGGYGTCERWPESASLATEHELVREDALSCRLAAEVQLDELIDELHVLVERDPEREVWSCLLIDTLVRRGRVGEAEKVYRTIVGVLSEQWGTEPGPELQRRARLLASGPVRPAPRDVTIVTASRAVFLDEGWVADPATCDRTADDDVRECVQRHGGTIVWRIQPVAMAVFTGRDHAERGIAAAHAVLDARRRVGRDDSTRITVVSGPASQVALENAAAPGRGGTVLSGAALARGREIFMDARNGAVTVDETTRRALAATHEAGVEAATPMAPRTLPRTDGGPYWSADRPAG